MKIYYKSCQSKLLSELQQSQKARKEQKEENFEGGENTIKPLRTERY